MSGNPSRSVVFITGTFIGNNCWDYWKSYFENEGYKCMAPTWPYTDYVEFKAHTHLVFGLPAWQEEAGCVLHWLQGLR